MCEGFCGPPDFGIGVAPCACPSAASRESSDRVALAGGLQLRVYRTVPLADLTQINLAVHDRLRQCIFVWASSRVRKSAGKCRTSVRRKCGCRWFTVWRPTAVLPMGQGGCGQTLCRDAGLAGLSNSAILRLSSFISSHIALTTAKPAASGRPKSHEKYHILRSTSCAGPGCIASGFCCKRGAVQCDSPAFGQPPDHQSPVSTGFANFRSHPPRSPCPTGLCRPTPCKAG